jgi:hypothetical protein
MSVFAGTFGSCGFPGDGLSSSIKFRTPWGLKYNFYTNSLLIVDNGNSRVRSINLTSNIITTIIGNGVSGFSGNGGLGVSASISNPDSVTVSVDGSIYLSDKNNSVIRQLDTAGYITIFAGTGTGSGYNGDNILYIINKYISHIMSFTLSNWNNCGK